MSCWVSLSLPRWLISTHFCHPWLPRRQLLCFLCTPAAWAQPCEPSLTALSWGEVLLPQSLGWDMAMRTQPCAQWQHYDQPHHPRVEL